jgi:RNA-directed DNA polymerase
MASLERFLSKQLRLQINRDKSAVARPWKRKFLGYSVTVDRKPKLKVAAQSIKRLKNKLRQAFRQGRGRNLGRIIRDLAPVIRGWVAYFRLSEVKAGFETLDEWLRRKLRCILWRQWKRPRTRAKKLRQLGVPETHARAGSCNGRGPWWNSGATHMNQAVPTRMLRRMGLLSFLEEHRRLACTS